MSAVAAAPPLFVLREGRESDLGFVLASWVESDRWSILARDAGRGVHKAEHRALATRLVEVGRLRVAHAPDDEEAILGWVSFRVPREDCVIVHYVYVKRPARRLGVASALVEPFGGTCIYTHRPVTRGVPIPEAWTYNPYRNWR